MSYPKAKEYELVPKHDHADDTAAPRVSTDSAVSEQTLPFPAVQDGKKTPTVPAFVYVIVWIALSSSIILFNKWILHTVKFAFPLFLTTWHLSFATIVTQILAHATKALDSRHKVPMTGKLYVKAIVPIAVFFSLSLICGNVAYLYLSVSFIQMLKSTNAVATLLAAWALRVAPPNLKQLGTVSIIVAGATIASFGEINFNLIGFSMQVGGIVFEAIRLVMVQRLLSSDEFKMDPLVSLYYFAPACAVMNGVTTLAIELPQMTLADFHNVGILTLLANGSVAFLLNVSVVFLIGKTSAVVMTLCGVLKDILLVAASMAFFRDPVTLIQAGGYSISLGGLVYYKLDAEKFKEAGSWLAKKWQELSEEHGVGLKIAVAALIVAGVFMLSVGAYVALQVPSVKALGHA